MIKSVEVGHMKRDNTLEDCKKEIIENILDLISIPGYWY